MIRRIFAYLLAVAAGCAIGIGSALGMAGLLPGTNSLAFGDVDVGGWRSDFATGSEAADAYTRARVARHGLLALAKSEAVYFTRATDDDGQPLREACTYRLTTGAMPAGWWSITLYNGDSMLPDNDDEALSINAGQDMAARIGDEIVGQGGTATIAPRRPEGRGLWISSRNAGRFDLTLRLYMPDDALLADPAGTLDPPQIERLACEDAA
ncbi:DUF1214 domain-containing protein [Erythrobacter sp.]|uniref:DUF1214 domain-containing protein n=1 Tax=Erythrobacter sp. TaxID=1042 RepID=UPI0025E7B696|nr:DUF1214 domain-containing protein [Erythrobacter sp.]